MTKMNGEIIVMSEFISFLEQALYLNDIAVKTELNIYAGREIEEGYYRNIYEYNLKSIDGTCNPIKLYFPSGDELLNRDIYQCDLKEYDIVVEYRQVIGELIQNVDRQMDSNYKNLIIDYIVMLLKEVELAGTEFNQDVYQELLKLCYQMKDTLDKSSFHFYAPNKQKSLN